jgi:hypothetical protein
VIAAVLAVVGYGVALAVGGVQPFGNRTMIVLDVRSEYAPYLAYVHHALAGHASVLFAWPSLGTNFAGDVGYYLASPVTLIAALLPVSWMPVAVELVTVVKVALAAAFMCVFLLRHLPHRRAAAVAFAVAYGLSAFNVVYSLNIMWLDATYLLPLICLCVDRVLSGRSRFPLALVLAWTMVTCFYAGYPAILFGGCYLIARLLMTGPAVALRRRLAAEMAWYAGMSVAAVAVAAVVLLPTLLQLRQRSVQPPIGHGITLHPNPLQLLGQQVSAPFVSVRFDGLPNVSLGIVATVLAAVFFVAPQVSRRVRVWWGVLLGFVALSLCVPLLTWAWQGFGETNWYLYRFSFVYSFAVATVGFLGLDAVAVRALASRRLVVPAATGFAAIGAALVHSGAHVAALGVDAALCLGLVGWLALRDRHGRALLVVTVAAVAVAANGVGAAALAMSAKIRQWPYPPVSSWTDRIDYGPAVLAAAGMAGPAGRTELAPRFTDNDLLVFGAPGPDYASTFSNGPAFLTWHALGLTWQVGAHNYVHAETADPLAVALLGVRTVVARTPLSGAGLTLSRTVPTASGLAYIYLVSGTASIARVVPLEVARTPTASIRQTANPFALAERLLGAPPSTLQSPAPITAERLDGVVAADVPGGQRLWLAPGRESGTVTWTVSVDRTGPLWVHVGTETFAGLGLRSRGHGYGYPESTNNGVTNLGHRDRGSTQVSLVLSRRRPVLVQSVQFATIEPAAVEGYLARATELSDVRRGSRSLSGRVSVATPGLLLVSVPYDRGWSATVDGRRATVRDVAGAFIGVALPAGSHRVALDYLPPGLRTGAVITGVGLLALMAFGALELRRRRATAMIDAEPEEIAIHPDAATVAFGG